MDCYICTQCGTQYSETESPPTSCGICSDERQFVNPQGQRWTALSELRRFHRNTVHRQGDGVIGIGVDPLVGIGQRALLVRGVGGNVLWDCAPFLDEGCAELIQSAGGLRAIAISHPHFHTSMVEWAHVFNCSIYIHHDNRQWVMRADSAIQFWTGETLDLSDTMTLIRCGGHFPGSAVLHHNRDGGELFTGDTFHVNPDRGSVGIMYSFPNYVPVSAATVERMLRAVEPFDFQRIYGQWWDAVIPSHGKDCIRRSAERYIEAIRGKYDAALAGR
jgi:glyoxylase-like metal-dependent hydrolase (beta-lactamase superfamily II)